MPPIQQPRVLTLSRRFLSFGIVFAGLCVLAGCGLLLAAFAVPEKVSFSSHLAAVPADARLRMMIIGAAGLVAASALFMPMLFHLRSLVDTAVAGDPFIAENGRRLRRLAWLVFGVDVVTRLSSMGVAAAAAREGGPFSLPFSFTGLLMVMMILVLAHIFEHGTRLRSDLQGTI